MARIIVADDHNVVRNGIRAILERQPSLRVCAVASNGQEAIDQTIAYKPDLVILDLSMPVVSGFQAALKIRQLFPTIKILVLSIHESVFVEQVAYLMGADAYLKKTSTEEEILGVVKSLLAGPSSPTRGALEKTILADGRVS